jgi:hypothetical protein
VVVLGTSTQPGNAQALREVELAGEALRMQLQYLDVLDPKDIETARSEPQARGVLTQSSCCRAPSLILTEYKLQISL